MQTWNSMKLILWFCLVNFYVLFDLVWKEKAAFSQKGENESETDTGKNSMEL